MNEVESYLINYNKAGKDVLLYLHTVLTEKFKLKPQLKYRLPFYYGKKWICYLNPRKDGNIDLSFLKGHLMHDWHPYLEQRDRKLVRSLVYRDLRDIDEKMLYDILRRSIELDF